MLAQEISEFVIREISEDSETKKILKNKSLEDLIISKINRGDIKKFTKEMLEQGPVGNFILNRKKIKDSTND